MSASWNRKHVVLPYVPPEIWQHILEITTLVSGSLDPAIEDPFDSVEPRQWRNRLTKTGIRDEQRAIRDSLITKRYIVRVCKQWHALGMPLLYQSIVVGKARALDPLLDILRRSQDSIGSGDDRDCSHPLGWWTRRFDLLLPKNVPLEGKAVKNIDEIISLLSNLSIFVLNKMPALRNVRTDFPLTMNTSRVTIDEALHLSSLSTMFEEALVADPGSDITSTTFTSFPAFATFPAFRHLHFRAEFFVSWHPSRSPYMLAHGAELTTLYLGCTELFNQHSFLALFSSEHCPRLVHLIIVCQSWDLLRGLRIPPQVARLGLLCESSQATDAVYNLVFDVLEGVMDPPTPSLRVVRFLNPRGSVDLKDRHRKVLLRGLDWLGRYDLRVEDHEGKDMRELLG